MTREELINAGFVRYTAHRPHALWLWQRRIVDPDESADKRFLYAINVWEYAPRFDLGIHRTSWEVRARLHFPGDDDQQGDLSYFVRPSTTIADLLEFYARAFEALKCVPDRDNQP